MNFLTLGTVAGVLAFGGTLAAAFGKPAFATFLTDPSTAQSVLAVISAGAALVAGVAKGVKG